MTDLEIQKYPIGRFKMPVNNSPRERQDHITILRSLPADIKSEVKDLTDQQLDTPYRDGGWTIRQVVHHLADSHMNSYCRFKLAVTEENPTIRPYYEARWAMTPDGISAPVALSLDLLDAIHTRWVWFLEKLPDEAWDRTFVHPENGITYTLYGTLALYSWHSRHHLTHITSLKTRMNW